MRTVLTGLNAGTTYYLQLRALGGNGLMSEWSRTFTITTATDTLSPKAPTNVAASMSGTSFILSWDAVTQSTDNTPAYDLAGYDVLVASDTNGGTATYRTTNTKFELPLETNRLIFGTPQASVKMSVRSIDKAGNSTGYSTPIVQTNAAPANVTGLASVGLIDSVQSSWTANTDTDLKGYVAYVGTTAGFTPGAGNKVWEGTGTSFVHQTLQYSTDLYVKVFAVDVFGTQSATAATAGPVRPKSAVSVDSTAPGVPAGLAATLTNATDGKSASAAVSWTAVTDTDNDLAGYVVGFRQTASPVNDWQYTIVDYTNTTTTIQGLVPYQNYDFRIRSYDFSANYSSWSTIVNAVSPANGAPATPTGLAITAGKDNIIVRWTANTEPDMANGAGTYDVTIATDAAFTANVLNYNTGADNIAINGLNTNQIYYARVRAKDAGGVTSGWATSVNATTGTYPGASLSDGLAPSTSPAPTVIGGPNYLYVFWTAITNADPVIYDVYMSTTNGFTTYDATTKVGEISGTSLIIERTAGGAALAYGTTYYVKIRARDRDGSAAAGTQGSAAPSKIVSGDITSVNADLITSGTSFTTNLFIGTGGAIQSTGYTSGGTSGFSLSNTGLTIKGTGNTVDASVLKGGTITGTTIYVGATGALIVDATGVIKSNNYAANSTGYQLSNTGLEVNDGSIDAKSLRTNTAIIGDLTIGRSADALGTIKSFDYAAGTAGWKIGKGLFEINQGTIKAAALLIQDSQNLMAPQFASFDFATTFYASSAGNFYYPPNTAVTIVTSGGKYGGQYLQVRSTSAAAFSTYMGNSDTDYWNFALEANTPYIISAWVKTGAVATTARLRVKNSSAVFADLTTVNLSANGGWQRISGVYTTSTVTDVVVLLTVDTATTGAGIDVDGVQVERQIAAQTTPSPWTPPGMTRVDGGIIRTGEIRSNSTVTVNGVAQPLWSINLAGGAQFGNAVIRGNLVVGTSGDADAGQSFIASGNYSAGVTGWKMDSAGNLYANTGSLRGDLIVDGTIKSPKLESGSITADKLNSQLILSGKMASSLTGRRWEADQAGIRLYDTDTTTLINLPTDASTPATFKGDVVARSLTSIDQFAMRGTGNEISKDSLLKLAAGTTAPVSPPSVLVYTPSVNITNPEPTAPSYDPRMHGWVKDGSYYYTVQKTTTSVRISRYDSTTLALDTGYNRTIGYQFPDGGMTIIGTTAYMLDRVQNTDDYYIHNVDITTGASFAGYPMTNWPNRALGYWPALGTDGTNLLIAYRTTGGSLNIHRVVPGTGSVVDTITTNITGWLWSVTSVNYGNFDYGAPRYVVTAENRDNYTPNPLSVVLAYSGTGTVWNLQQNEQWPMPGQTHGMCWDAAKGRFVSMDFSSLTVNTWTPITWTTESNQWWASTTWYDSNATGGTHETTQSAPTTFTMRKRGAVRITSSPIPPRPTPNTTDDVMRPRFYVGRGATDPTRTGMWLQSEVADGVNYTEQYGTVAFSGTNPPSTNNFPGANPAKLTSWDGSAIVLAGDGSGNFGSLVVANGRTNLGTHAMRATAVAASQTVTSAGWTLMKWSGTTSINEDSWTLSADQIYWTCAVAGTYSVFYKFGLDGPRQWRIEVNAESTADGLMRGNAFTANHDYLTVTIPQVRMSVGDRVYAQGILQSGQTTANISSTTSQIVISRLG